METFYVQKFRFCFLDILVLSVILIIGIIHLFFPLSGDQALFMIAAKKMAAGGVLYKDFLDAKQPGIYIFYFLAGKIFGFNEMGVHLFELLYWLFFSVLLIVFFRHWDFFENRTLTSLIPLFIVGVYYSNALPSHLTQIEALVNFPMFILIALLFEAQKPSKDYSLLLFYSGLAAIIVISFKIIFIPIVGTFYLTFFISEFHKRTLKELFLNAFLPIIAGLLIPILLFSIYYFQYGILENVIHSFFILPQSVLASTMEIHPERLVRSANWFFSNMILFCIFSFIGFAIMQRTFKLLSILILTWIALGFLVILMQKISWWEYHFQLLYVPIGVLAAKGIDFIWKDLKIIGGYSHQVKRMATLSAIVLLLFFIQFHAIVQKGEKFKNNNYALAQADRLSFWRSIDTTNYSIEKETDFFKINNCIPGNIFVCGDPRYYIYADRDQSIPLHGWAFEFFIPEQWTHFTEQIKIAKPSYIFVDNNYRVTIDENCPQLNTLLKDQYDIKTQSNNGIWFALRKKELNEQAKL